MLTVQLATNTTSEIVDAGGGDLEMQHTLSANGWAVVVKDGFSTAGACESVLKFSIANGSDLNAPVGACLAQSDNQAYAWRRSGTGLWRISLFSTTGTVTGSVGFSDVSFSEPTDGSPMWSLIGRDGSGNVYGSLWITDGGRPGSPMAGPTNPTTDLGTVTPGACSFDSSDDPFRFRWLGTATAGDLAPESAGGGTVTTQTLTSTILLDDQPLDYVFYNRRLESGITLTDELVAILVGTISRILTDTLTVDDGAVLFYRRNRLLDDTIDVVDSVLRYLLLNRALSDSVVITDSLISAIINYVVNVATLSSTIAVTDDEDHFLRVTRLVESTLGLYDESQSALLRFITLTDALSVVDSATATYVPDPAIPGQVFNPIIRIGFDQPRIDIGGYGI